MQFVAVTSCPTGIAHTYMAAEALEQAGRAAGHQVTVETQGSAGSTPLDPALIAAADGVIFAADLEVRGRERFAGKPTVEVGVKKAVHDAPAVVARAVDAVGAGSTGPAGGSAAPVVASPVAVAPVSPPAARVGARIRQWLMTGVSYMIPFVAAGGILIAAGFMLSNLAWGEDGPVAVTRIIGSASPYALDYAAAHGIALPEGSQLTLSAFATHFGWLSAASWSVLLFQIGVTAFGFLVSALSAYIAFAIADRPGLVPGFVAGMLANTVGAGFLGGIATGFLAGGLAWWLSSRKVPKGVRGVMPVVVVPLTATLVAAAATVLVIGPPMAAVNDGLGALLNGLGTGYLIPLGILLGLMQCTDLGGPVNKVAYVFAVTGLANATTSGSTEARVMAAVMAAGMVPPLAIAAATALRPKIFTLAERESGKSCWLLGASFISEGAIPFAAKDPFRMIPSFMVGGAITGGLAMALGSGQLAPHGGIWVLPLIGEPFMFLLALAAGTLAAAGLVILAKSIGRRADDAQPAAESREVLAGSTA